MIKNKVLYCIGIGQNAHSTNRESGVLTTK